jgi:hypothetical protein
MKQGQTRDTHHVQPAVSPNLQLPSAITAGHISLLLSTRSSPPTILNHPHSPFLGLSASPVAAVVLCASPWFVEGLSSLSVFSSPSCRQPCLFLLPSLSSWLVVATYQTHRHDSLRMLRRGSTPYPRCSHHKMLFPDHWSLTGFPPRITPSPTARLFLANEGGGYGGPPTIQPSRFVTLFAFRYQRSSTAPTDGKPSPETASTSPVLLRPSVVISPVRNCLSAVVVSRQRCRRRRQTREAFLGAAEERGSGMVFPRSGRVARPEGVSGLCKPYSIGLLRWRSFVSTRRRL